MSSQDTIAYVISGAALLVSLSALAVSVLSHRFNRRAKSTELRAALLSKIAEARTQHLAVKHQVDSLVAISPELRTSEKTQAFHLTMEKLSKFIDSAHRATASQNLDLTLSAYAENYHKVHEVQQQLSTAAAGFKEIDEKIRSRSNPHGRISEQSFASSHDYMLWNVRNYIESKSADLGKRAFSLDVRDNTVTLRYLPRGAGSAPTKTFSYPYLSATGPSLVAEGERVVKRIEHDLLKARILK